MSRKNIWEKDDFFILGLQRIDMDPAVVKLEQDLPLVYGYDWSGELLGKVTDVRLEDGVISGEVEVFDETLEEAWEGHCRLGGYYLDVFKNEDGTQVLSATLKGVSYIMNANSPREFLKNANSPKEFLK